MFCTSCGEDVGSTSERCDFCGASTGFNRSASPAVLQAVASPPTSFNPYAPPESPIEAPSEWRERPVASKPHPWIRYWARLFDVYVAGFASGIVIGFVNPEAFDTRFNAQLFGMVIVLAWIPIEAFLLSALGATPGKFLFKIRVASSSGERLDFQTALTRSFRVWWRGLGAGLPIITLITQVQAYNNLTRNGETTWDRDDDLVVVHGRVGILRVLMVIMIFTAFLYLVTLGTIADM